jgi:hypothetical protein
MAWGIVGNVTTTHLDSASDDPSQARVELYNALLELQNVINGRNTANGVAGLNASSKIVGSYLPNTIVSDASTNLTLQPTTGKVVLEDILALTPQTVAELTARTDQAEGDVAYCSDGDAGSKCIAIYNGTDWKVVSLGSTIST